MLVRGVHEEPLGVADVRAALPRTFRVATAREQVQEVEALEVQVRRAADRGRSVSAGTLMVRCGARWGGWLEACVMPRCMGWGVSVIHMVQAVRDAEMEAATREAEMGEAKEQLGGGSVAVEWAAAKYREARSKWRRSCERAERLLARGVLASKLQDLRDEMEAAPSPTM